MQIKKDTPFWDISLSDDERIDWLLSAMTMEEKLEQLSGSGKDIERLGIPRMGVGGEAAHGVEARNDQNGLGTPESTTSFPQPIGMSASWDPELVKKAGEVTGTEARVLYHRHPEGGLSRWAPTIDLERDPRWGRTEESYGEDPVLTGRMSAAYIQGMQGEEPWRHLRVAATLKHFYANNTEEGRGWKNSSVDPRNRYELYYEPFRRAIQEGHAEAVMTAYNKINGVPGILNHEVRDVLKKQYGLKHAVSDGGAMELVVKYHHTYGMHAETLANALKAGVDSMSDNPGVVAEAAKEAYELGLITEAEVDEALRNMFGTKIRLGIYDAVPTNPYDQVTEADLDAPKSREICRTLSRESIVLLKNDGSLPLKKEAAESFAVIGPFADRWDQDWYGGEPAHRSTLKDGMNALLNGDLSTADGWNRVILRAGEKGVTAAEDGRLYISEKPDTFVMEDWGEGSFAFRNVRTGKYMNMRLPVPGADDADEGVIAAEKAAAFDWFVLEIFHCLPEKDGLVRLTTRFEDPVGVDSDGYLTSKKTGKEVLFSIEITENGSEKAAALAREKKTVILALGSNPMINAKETVDRADINFPPAQQKLLETVYEANPDMILVLFANYPYAIGWAKDHVRAIVLSATGSQDMGIAMAETLFGDSAPAGRLNMTWYCSDAQLPPIDDYDIIRGKRTYRYFDGEVLYPFGYGLTYSSFAYSDLKVEIPDYTRMLVSFSVTNTGSRVSDEVAQVYASAPPSRVKKPIVQLLDFQRVKQVEPGETRRLTFSIPVRELRFYNVIGGSLMVEGGTYRILAGPSSKELPLEAFAEVTGGKPGLRSFKKRTAADHYDEYENMLLTEGQYGFCAAMPADLHSPGVLSYRSWETEELPSELIVHVKTGGTASVTVMANDTEVGSWQGDTRLYLSSPEFAPDTREKRDMELRHASWKPIYADVHISLDPEALKKAFAQIEPEKTQISLLINGEAALCWLRWA